MNSHRIEGMLKERADSAENTRLRLDAALARFEKGDLDVLPAGSKLTVRNLAAEAKVSKDTPLSRYPKGHPKSKDYRFPEIVSRFRKLKEKNAKPEEKEDLVIKLRKRNKELENQIQQSAQANNLLDAENVELLSRNRELEENNVRLREENAQLRQGNIRVL